jgi:hypothetical protein
MPPPPAAGACLKALNHLANLRFPQALAGLMGLLSAVAVGAKNAYPGPFRQASWEK